VSGGFSQGYYDKSKAAGNKKTNMAAVLKGKGKGMLPDK
jgi:photosystem II PsbM protein